MAGIGKQRGCSVVKQAVKPKQNVRQKNVTSYDVARMAGVSQSAVSRAFASGNDVSQNVSKKTREKVVEAANKLGYRPNALARMLITKPSSMVAVITSSAVN
jgi:DNA-binding LacI/PurR family transcriptional regulator